MTEELSEAEIDAINARLGENGGLSGNTGLVYDDAGHLVMHINASYDANGMVFVEGHYRDAFGSEWDSWPRMPMEQAKTEQRRVIGCYCCGEPAVLLDHSWPWMTEMCRCEEHKNLDWKEADALANARTQERR